MFFWLRRKLLVARLHRIARASMNPSGAPSSLDSYEKRDAAAQAIGRELHAKGGERLMREVLEKDMGWCEGCRTIEQFWGGIGEWRG